MGLNLLSDYYSQGIGGGIYECRLPEYASLRKVRHLGPQGKRSTIRFYARFGFRFDGEAQTLDFGGEKTELRMVLNRHPKVE